MRARSVFVSLLIICASISYNGRNNIVGRVSCEGKGIKGVVVSDGISTVQTDSRGRYKMHSEIKVVVTDRFGNTYTSGITPVLDY